MDTLCLSGTCGEDVLPGIYFPLVNYVGKAVKTNI